MYFLYIYFVHLFTQGTRLALLCKVLLIYRISLERGQEIQLT